MAICARYILHIFYFDQSLLGIFGRPLPTFDLPLAQIVASGSFLPDVKNYLKYFFSTPNMVLTAGNYKWKINKFNHLNRKLKHFSCKFKYLIENLNILTGKLNFWTAISNISAANFKHLTCTFNTVRTTNWNILTTNWSLAHWIKVWKCDNSVLVFIQKHWSLVAKNSKLNH